MTCISCHGTADSEQQCYCTRCFIPVSHPKTRNGDTIYQQRAKNRSSLAREIIRGTPGALQFIQDIGLEKLPLEDLAAAMSAIGEEKLHFFSGEYSWKEAQTMIDLGYGVAQELDQQWVKEITTLRLVKQELRGGWLVEAREHLTHFSLNDLGENIHKYEDTERIRRVFQNIEVLALYALLDSLEGNEAKGEYVEQLVFHMWEVMQTNITQLIANSKRQSFYMGLKDSAYKVPRLDKLAFIQKLLIEAAIAQCTDNFEDRVVERLMVLGRMTIILGEMSPTDDSIFYSSVLREYLQMFNGVFWHLDAVAEIDLDLGQKALLQVHAILLQWMHLIPPHYWLQVRLARTLEVLYRTMKTLPQLSPDMFTEYWLQEGKGEIVPYIHYIIGEAKINAGMLEDGNKHILQVIQTPDVNKQVVSMAKELLQRSLLEQDGILVGTSFPSRIDSLEVILEVPKGKGESEHLFTMPIGLAKQNIVLPPSDSIALIKFTAAEKYLPKQIGIDGTRLNALIYDSPNYTNINFNQSIITVGSAYYRDAHWYSPFFNESLPVSGVRTDIVALRVLLTVEEQVDFLLEATKIDIIEENQTKVITEPEYYILRGVRAVDKEGEELLEILANVINYLGNYLQIDIYTLKFEA